MDNTMRVFTTRVQMNSQSDDRGNTIKQVIITRKIFSITYSKEVDTKTVIVQLKSNIKL